MDGKIILLLQILTALIQLFTIIILIWHGKIFSMQEEFTLIEVFIKYLEKWRYENNPEIKKLFCQLLKEIERKAGNLPKNIKEQIENLKC